MKNFCLIINTVTKCKDAWPMFFGQLRERFPQIEKKYVFVDDTNYDFGDDFNVVFYDKNKQYRDQLIDCFPKVEEKYCLYLQEDYILYDDVDWLEMCKIIDFLELNKSVDFVKLIKGPDVVESVPLDMSMNLPLYYILEAVFYYNQLPIIWRMDKLVKIFEETPNSHIGDDNYVHFEVEANVACKKYCTGLLYYKGEPKRGIHHYDSTIFPFVASALVRGKWNVSEYSKELIPLLDKYNIDINVRGTY